MCIKSISIHSDNFQLSAKTSFAMSVKLRVLLSSLIFFGSSQVFDWSLKSLFWDAFSKNLEISLVSDLMIIIYNNCDQILSATTLHYDNQIL